ncbi:hypothetical protein Tco_1050341 [Tanacetum coccineum]
MTTENKHPRGVILQTARTLFVYKKPNAPCWRERREDGDGGDVMVASVGRQPEEGAARGGECYRGSSRSADEERLWCWPENSPEKFSGSRRSNAYAGNPVKEIDLNLNLPDHRSILTEPEVHVKMEMEIPRSSRVKFITACSYSIDKYKDMMKAQVHVTQVFSYSDT